MALDDYYFCEMCSGFFFRYRKVKDIEEEVCPNCIPNIVNSYSRSRRRKLEMRYDQVDRSFTKHPKSKRIEEFVDSHIYYDEIPKDWKLCGWCCRIWDGVNKFITIKKKKCSDCSEIHKVGRTKKDSEKYYLLISQKDLNRERE